MPITYRKSFQIFPGVRLNINRKSWSLTFGGGKSPRYTRSSTGRDTISQNLPGGLGYRTTRTRRRQGGSR
ncbi:DUF4236 domain-containing protein [Streptomyces sp. NPDC054871]